MEPAPVRPFVKWAGGKTQLLDEFVRRFPEGLRSGAITRYVEPFLGGGAVFFTVARQFHPRMCHLFDINRELVLTYTVVKEDLEELLEELRALASAYLPLDGEGRRRMYYAVRDRFNRNRAEVDLSSHGRLRTLRAAEMIFLNRTCFNGLFRVNSRGDFNVPHGKYRNPRIFDEENLRAASRLLAHAEIRQGDFTACGPTVDRGTFVYIDPPYRPLTRTSMFTSYAEGGFGDTDQIRLAEFCRKIDEKGALFMLSNSDPKNADPGDDFFDDLYDGFVIERVSARRAINCNGRRRGPLNELIITNYRPSPRRKG